MRPLDRPLEVYQKMNHLKPLRMNHPLPRSTRFFVDVWILFPVGEEEPLCPWYGFREGIGSASQCDNPHCTASPAESYLRIIRYCCRQLPR